MRFGSNSPWCPAAHKIGDGLGRMVSEQGDLDVAAVSVQRGGSGRKGAVSHGITVCHYARAGPHPVPGTQTRTRRTRNEPADGPVMAVCEGT